MIYSNQFLHPSALFFQKQFKNIHLPVHLELQQCHHTKPQLLEKHPAPFVSVKTLTKLLR